MTTWTWLLLIPVALLIWKAWSGRRSSEDLLRAAQALTAGAKLVDVRSAREFAGGHHPGAINIPLHELVSRLGQLGPKSRTVVLCCATGSRSVAAARVMREAGFSEVLDLGPLRNLERLPAVAEQPVGSSRAERRRAARQGR